MDWVFWVILGGILLAAAIAGAAVWVAARRQRAELRQAGRAGTLPQAPAPPTPEVSAPEGATPAQGGTPAVLPATGQPAGAVLVPEEAVAPAPEIPEAAAPRMVRLRRRLASSTNALARAVAQLLSTDRIDQDTWDDFEATLISSDLGVGPTTELVTNLRQKLAVEGIADPARARQVLREELVALVRPDMDRRLHLEHSEGIPAVVMVVGVNGTGKTTTVGKLGRLLVAEHHSVLFGAADTFRAAAADQLQTWGDRVGVQTVRGAEGADPASVAHAAVEAGTRSGVDVVLIDTAGRLHTKVGLMDELGKVKRVASRLAPVTEVLLVLDATTGQNGLAQARVFAEAVDITGIALTKLDGSAKGGIVVQVQRELGVPVKLIGLGEGADDLAVFDAGQFVDGLLGS